MSEIDLKRAETSFASAKLLLDNADYNGAVDARGLKCPLPVLLARRALKTRAEVTLLTDDQASILDVPVFCAREGYAVETSQVESGYRFMIKKTDVISTEVSASERSGEI
jgi:tRNA 2-thiouridine synthesizing protein A